jgi:hypothetical protein
VRDNSGGIVIGAEQERSKVAVARGHFREARLDAYIDVREGDILEALKEAFVEGLCAAFRPRTKLSRLIARQLGRSGWRWMSSMQWQRSCLRLGVPRAWAAT